MKIILTTFLLLISTSIFAEKYTLEIPADITTKDKIMFLPIIDVYDGDTIKTHMHWYLPKPLAKVSIRVRGIDTPEMPAKSYKTTGKLGRAKCVKEAELALKAKQAVINLMHIPRYDYMIITNYKWGKYGGRIVADVNIHDINVSEMLIDQGLAVKYDGTGTKNDWCKP